jgi:hypothetical protein
MRFTAAKELCHIAIDQREDWSPRGHETIQNMLVEDQLDQQEMAMESLYMPGNARLAVSFKPGRNERGRQLRRPYFSLVSVFKYST